MVIFPEMGLDICQTENTLILIETFVEKGKEKTRRGREQKLAKGRRRGVRERAGDAPLPQCCHKGEETNSK